jgi:hypothetical protein
MMRLVNDVAMSSYECNQCHIKATFYDALRIEKNHNFGLSTVRSRSLSLVLATPGACSLDNDAKLV